MTKADRLLLLWKMLKNVFWRVKWNSFIRMKRKDHTSAKLGGRGKGCEAVFSLPVSEDGAGDDALGSSECCEGLCSVMPNRFWQNGHFSLWRRIPHLPRCQPPPREPPLPRSAPRSSGGNAWSPNQFTPTLAFGGSRLRPGPCRELDCLPPAESRRTWNGDIFPFLLLSPSSSQNSLHLEHANPAPPGHAFVPTDPFSLLSSPATDFSPPSPLVDSFPILVLFPHFGSKSVIEKVGKAKFLHRVRVRSRINKGQKCYTEKESCFWNESWLRARAKQI